MRANWENAGIALVVLLAVVGWADPPPSGDSLAAEAVDRLIINEVKSGNQIMTNLSYLSDVIGPRVTGSANLKRANEWTADKFKEYGLEQVRLEPWELPIGWERGSASMRLVDPPNGKQLTVASMAWTPGTNGKVTGPVQIVRLTSRDDFAQWKGKLKNAVILRGAPSTVRPISEPDRRPPAVIGDEGPRRPASSGPDAAAPAVKSPEEKKPAEPAPPLSLVQGWGLGIGLLPLLQPPPSEKKEEPKPAEKPPESKPESKPAAKPFERPFESMRAFQTEMREFLRGEGVAAILIDAGKPHGLLNMTGSWRGVDRGNLESAIPTLFMIHEDYALLYRLASRKDLPPPQVELEVANRFIPGPLAVYNTVGEIPGTDKPEEFVVLGAHLDSWDLGQGTTDNGTGSCVVLEAARVLGKLARDGIKPRRTIRFVLFSGEEQGLYGSRAYCERHKHEMAKTSMALVHDTGTGRVVGIGMQGRSALVPLLSREWATLKELGVTVNERSLSGTDHQAFEAVGVPGFACQQDPAEYRLTHHSQSDTLDKAREPDLIQGAQVMAVAAMRVANLPELLPRNKTTAPAKTPQ